MSDPLARPVDALVRPIADLADGLGSGVLGPHGPAAALTAATDGLTTLHEQGSAAIAELDAAWNGPAAASALDKLHTVTAAVTDLAERGAQIAATVSRAAGTVGTGAAELDGLLESFARITRDLTPMRGTLEGQVLLLGAALEHLGKAITVAVGVEQQLAGQGAAMQTLTEPIALPSAPGPVSVPAAPSAPATPRTTVLSKSR
ncbi:hypothetical protein G4X40_01735 [Rhodococcus sp. D2-41]|uniref:hypothetical protein n=1 Tax=Speluncibacter jeojiensis TaxID=2710754 RepID=UPI00240F6489|nr:hypothetical protein [Rhodococcus sp. D2-41]MDG3008865.1 hypothetical protein [Rhodococcus sp. D2-41]